MDTNVCGVDRRIRLAAGAALLALALGPSSGDDESVSLARVLAAYGASELLLINGLLQWCPLNAALGFDSCAGERSDSGRLGGRVPVLGDE